MIAKLSNAEKDALEENRVVAAEIMEFVPDEAPDRTHIRRDPIFDDAKIKVGSPNR